MQIFQPVQYNDVQTWNLTANSTSQYKSFEKQSSTLEGKKFEAKSLGESVK